MLTSGDKTNREYVGNNLALTGSVDDSLLKLFFDPQTAGGMLIAIPESKAEVLLVTLRKYYPQAQVIARVLPPGPRSIIVNGRK
jgi:selenide,water dikinase